MAASVVACSLPAAANADDTIIVTSKADSGAGSLRAALADANTSPDHDTIVFASSVTGTIDLHSELPVNYSTTIHGPGASNLELYGNDSRALFFYAFEPATLAVDGVSIQALTYDFAANASLVGTAITGNCVGEEGSIELTDVDVHDSRSFKAGGAIFSDGCDLSLERASVTGNRTQISTYLTGSQDGGAIKVIDTPGGGAADSVEILDSDLSRNRAVHEGGALSVGGGAEPDVTIRDSTVADNFSGDEGGALYFASAGDVSIERTTISGNRSGADGAGVYFGFGDALTVDSTALSDNRTSVGRGGALFVYAHQAPFSVRNTTVSGNGAVRGGGIYSVNYYDEPVTVANSTIAGNSGDGIVRYGFDGTGPLFAGPDELTISSSIVANSETTNDISTGSGTPSGAFRIDHSIIGVTSGRSGTPAIVETAPGSNQLGVGPVALGPLADNGGPTRTMLPAATSPAIDAGVANGLTVDQRGQARTLDAATSNGAGDGTDIGAVEQTDLALQGVTIGAKSVQKQRGKKVAVVVEVSSGEPASVRASGVVGIGKRSVPLGDAGVELAAGQTASLRLTPVSRKARKKILAALGKGKRVKAAIEITVTDAAGNSETEDEIVRLKPKRKRKK